jgi:hypothetical protein
MRSLGAAVFVAIVAASSASLARTPPFYNYWEKRRPELQSFQFLSAASDLCGLALAGIGWWDTPGYTILHRDIPIYRIPVMATRDDPRFNYVLVRTSAPSPEAAQCWHGEICLYRRPGACSGSEEGVARPRRAGIRPG